MGTPLSPTPHPAQWDVPAVCAFLAALAPSQAAHAPAFRTHGIAGDVLLALDAQALRELGVRSVGQRLVILTAVWRLKQEWGIALDDGEWRPSSHDLLSSSSSSSSFPSTAASSHSTHVSFAAALRVRDERIRLLEGEVSQLAEYLSRFQHDFAGVCRMLGVRNPSSEHPAPSLASKPADPLLFTPESTLAALALPSPRAPVSGAGMHTASPVQSGASLESPRRLAAAQRTVPDETHLSAEELPPLSKARTPTSAHAVSESGEATGLTPTSAHPAGRTAAAATTPGGSALAATPGGSALASGRAASPAVPARAGSATPGERSEGKSSAKDDAANPYKSFRVTLDDPCHKVLPAALKKYKINDDWRQYALFICYGNTERCLSYDEKPLLLFQKLKEAKQNPVFMLRHIRDVKSPIAIANAKAAARKNGAAKEGDAPEASPTKARSGSRAAGKVAEAVARFGGHTRDGSTGDADESGPSGTAANGAEAPALLPSVEGSDPVISGPASQLPPSTAPPTYAIAIYPYVSERADEFDVGVGATFVVLSKAKGWWVVQRDRAGSGRADVEGARGRDDENGPHPGVINSGWVPAGCLLETSRPLAGVFLSAPDEDGEAGDKVRSMATAPIPPAVITSTSTPGVMLMDYAAPEDALDLRKEDRLRVFKRYNHWSYCVAESETHARGWVPSWYIGKLASSSSSRSRHGAGGGGSNTTDAAASAPTPTPGSGTGENVPLP